MRSLLLKANKRIDVLESELKSLSNVVRKSLGLSGQVDAQAKPGGGRTAVRISHLSLTRFRKGGSSLHHFFGFQARILFHVEMMFGLKGESDPLPAPASADDQEIWDCEVDLDTIDINMHEASEPSNGVVCIDPCFPYPDGPGHKKATRQQLSVMCQLMKAAGIKSFQPNLAESSALRENQYLWGLSEKIFFKLVQLGVYTGVSPEPDNIAYIKKCFATHIKSLMKR